MLAKFSGTSFYEKKGKKRGGKKERRKDVDFDEENFLTSVLPTARRQLQSPNTQRAVSRGALRAIAGLMGGVCGRFFGDAERTSPEMTTGWMPTYGSGKGDEPMMSGKLFKRSSLHGTFQPRHFELLLNKQTGEVSSTGHCAPSDSNVFRTFAARSQVVLQYRSLQEKTVKQIQWSQVRAVNRCRPSANQEFEFTISLRPGVVAKDDAKDDVDAATAMPDVILRARDGLALEAWLAGSGAPAAHTRKCSSHNPRRVRACGPNPRVRVCACMAGLPPIQRPSSAQSPVAHTVASGRGSSSLRSPKKWAIGQKSSFKQPSNLLVEAI